MTPSYRGKILIVDDLKENLFVLNHVLKSKNYEVLQASSGAEALECLAKVCPDLILLDLMMPDMDGFEVCRIIKQDDRIKDIPLVFLTSNISVDSNLKGLELGAADYIFKPFNKNLLLKKVEQFISFKKQISEISDFDPLTHLPIRESICKSLDEDLIPKAIELNSLLAVVTINLSRFKFINDSHGRDFGDKTLLAVVARLSSFITESGEQNLLGRTGGDEFSIVFSAIEDKDRFTETLSALVQHLAEPYDMGGSNLFIQYNMGVAYFPDDSSDASTLLQCSIRAMYSAKKSIGFDYQQYDASIEENTKSRAFIENEIYSALVRKDFVLHYQPQYDIKNQRYSGLEALVRWMHPTEGMISPDRFIPIAENNGLIIDIGTWIIEEAIRFCVENEAKLEERTRISINLSPVQLWDKSFLSTIKDITNKYSIDPSLVEYEITEGLMIDDKNKALEVLNSIKTIGSRVAIDDFGTGFSALTYLKFMPIDTLKLDRSFIINIPQDRKDNAIVSSIIALGKNLDLDLVAEGVETVEQLTYLQSKHCDIIQGYYFSRPLPSNELIEFLSVNKRK